jgi:glutaredoxin-related protein
MTAADGSTTSASTTSPNPVIKLAANVMSLLKPIFAAEATIQAAVLGALSNVDKDVVASNIETLKKENNVLIYTYALSPFSTEALSILDAYGCNYKNVELGLEWFLLGGTESETRVALSKEVESGATSLPKIFIGGECIGGYAELASLVESGELEEKLKKVTKGDSSSSSVMPNLFAGLFK